MYQQNFLTKPSAFRFSDVKLLLSIIKFFPPEQIHWYVDISVIAAVVLTVNLDYLTVKTFLYGPLNFTGNRAAYFYKFVR